MSGEKWQWWNFSQSKQNFYLMESTEKSLQKQYHKIEELTETSKIFNVVRELMAQKRYHVCNVIKKDGVWYAIASMHNIRYRYIELEFFLFDCSRPIQLFYHCACLQTIYTEDDIYIRDVQVSKEDACQGFGTMLMNELLKTAKGNNISTITGTLRPYDLNDHPERLQYFYRKFGFTITDIVSADGNIHEKRIELRL